MDATTAAAWVGAVTGMGGVAISGASFLHERKKSRPDAVVTASYVPGTTGHPQGRDRQPTVRIDVQAGSVFTVMRAGLGRRGWLWRRRRLEPLTGKAFPETGPADQPLPATVVAGDRMAIHVERDEAIRRGLDPAQSHLAWIETSGGQVVWSAQSFTLEPEGEPALIYDIRTKTWGRAGDPTDEEE